MPEEEPPARMATPVRACARLHCPAGTPRSLHHRNTSVPDFLAWPRDPDVALSLVFILSRLLVRIGLMGPSIAIDCCLVYDIVSIAL